MDPRDKKQQPDPLADTKQTAPNAMPQSALTPREAARLWGTGSGRLPGDPIRRRYPYSIM